VRGPLFFSYCVAMLARVVIVSAGLLLAACERDSAAPTSEQNHDLDAASRMLDEAPSDLNRIDENALLPTNEVTNSEGR
jgi:hypothetical protein